MDLTSNPFQPAAIAFLICIVGMYLMVPIAKQLGLVDRPTRRKRHMGTIPLIGGITIFASTLVASALFLKPNQDLLYILSAAGLVTVTGALDDRFDLNFKIRLVVQVIAALVLVYGSNTQINSFGDFLGLGSIDLGVFSVPVTVFAVVGMMNAFNMVDGIDGLAGGLVMVAVLSLYFILPAGGAGTARIILLLIAGALTAYLVFNLHLLGRITPKVFMGDAGSMFLGFVVTAFLIRYSQVGNAPFTPVTALWLVAVPLMDMCVTSIRRVRSGKSPFHADRTHLHHIIIRVGFSQRQALIIIVTYAGMVASLGLSLQASSQLFSFGLFVALFAGHILWLRWLSGTARKRVRNKTRKGSAVVALDSEQEAVDPLI